MGRLVDLVLHLDRHLADFVSSYGTATYAILCAILFCETGLVVTPFLPGDSLLFAIGAIASTGALDVHVALPLLMLAVVAGDNTNYWIGRTLGPRVFHYERSRFFDRRHLDRTHAFYERHGGKTIVLARFMPIIRTFAPVVAGVGRMPYGRFVAYNVFGGIGWVCSMILTGYFLTRLIDPPLQSLLGRPEFTVREHIEKIVILVVLLSIAPGGVAWVRSKLRKKDEVLEPVAAE